MIETLIAIVGLSSLFIILRREAQRMQPKKEKPPLIERLESGECLFMGKVIGTDGASSDIKVAATGKK